jgi:hypothetical protein
MFDDPVPQAIENRTPTISNAIKRRVSTGTELLMKKWKANLGLELLENPRQRLSKVNF